MKKEVTDLDWTYKSEVGRVRSHNEDSVLIHAPSQQLVFVVVADGMGGHKAGDVASQLAVEVVKEQLLEVTPNDSLPELNKKLKESMEVANRSILRKSREDESVAGMGTTLVVAILKEEKIMIGNIGDSRAYLLNEEKCEQLTRDHSLVNELVHMGEITEVEAEGHPQKNVLIRAVGTDPEVAADINEHTWAVGDYLLVCTDGLTNMVSDELIHAVIKTDNTIEWKADELVRHALEAGGLDNISLALVKRTMPRQTSPGSQREAG